MTSPADPVDVAVGIESVAHVGARYALDARGYLMRELTGDERRRFGAIAPARRLPWLTARAAAKPLLCKGDRHSCGIGTDGHGRPLGPPGMALSLAHTSSYAAAAISRTGHVGVDIEPLRPFDAAAVAAVFDPDELRASQALPVSVEHRALTLWSLKEAVVKALGTGFRYGWSTVRLREIAGTRALVSVRCPRQTELELTLRHLHRDDHLVTVVHVGHSSVPTEVSP